MFPIPSTAETGKLWAHPVFKLTRYADPHRAELERLLETPAWQEALSSGLVEEAADARLEPPAPRNFIDTVVDQLLDFSRRPVAEMIASGCRDEQLLLGRLARWPADLDGKAPVISFLGLNVTAQCNLAPKCVYCNQYGAEDSVDMPRWRAVIEQATSAGDGKGPYIHLTGGEPLLLGADVWGDDGLVRFATRRGAAVNVNTNATLLTPVVALRLIKAGLAKLHVSLDTDDEALHNRLRGGTFRQVLQGLCNMQLARELVGVSYPVIHTNCVLTRENLHRFPELVAFILEHRKQAVQKDDPFREDLLPHVIPVGGDGNAPLRPDAREFRRFYDEVWPVVCGMWSDYQDALGVSKESRRELFGYFSNPFLRVEHAGGLEAYVQTSAEGRYGRLALSRHCYVAPTQAAFTPDGFQYRCGCHAIRRTLPVGNIHQQDMFTGIRKGLAGLDRLPQPEHCYGCALATLYINQSVQTRLKEKIAEMLKDI
jgi:MoaA/NifB/PqqE/SkfB family radical SAM enzyme